MLGSKALRLALVQIAVGDTGAGGLVALTGNPAPLILQRSLVDVKLPIVTYLFLPGREGTMQGKGRATVRFGCWTSPQESGATYVEAAEALRSRVHAAFTMPALKLKNVDAAVLNPRPRDGGQDGRGVFGLFLDLDFVNVS